jgi:hypothetical protein
LILLYVSSFIGLKMTKEELVKFNAYFPQLVKPCFYCRGEGKKVWDLRIVDCWDCHATGIEINCEALAKDALRRIEEAQSGHSTD